MGESYPTILAFHTREVPIPAKEQEETRYPPTERGDGFSGEELADALDPLKRKWDPRREYDECTIDKLVPGPKAVTFVGRIVNLTTIHGNSDEQPKAAGWHHLILKDHAAAISVCFSPYQIAAPLLTSRTQIKLNFSNSQYPLKLGQLLSIWTTFISDATKLNARAISGVLLYANRFPGRVTSDHVMIKTNSAMETLCRVPLDYCKGKSLQGLMTLDSYLRSGGHDVGVEAKLLVCVKSIGARKRISKKAGGDIEMVEVRLFENTGEVRWTLWGDTIESAKDWEPGKTILLISNPGYQVEVNSRKDSILVQRTTMERMIDVDPDFPDA